MAVCDPGGGKCSPIAGATGPGFTPDAAQVGRTVRVVDIASDPSIAKVSSSTSPATGLVAASAGSSGSSGAGGGSIAKPSNAAVLGKFTRNRKRGTGALLVSVPSAGTLTLTGKGVKKATARAAAPGKVRLRVQATGKAKKRLNAKGRVKVALTITFQPTGGDTASQSRTLSLRRIPAR